MKYVRVIPREDLKGLNTMRTDAVIVYGKVEQAYKAYEKSTDMVVIEGHNIPIDIGSGDIDNPRPNVEGLRGLYIVIHPDHTIQFVNESAFLSFKDNRERQDKKKNEKVERYESVFTLIGETIEGIKNEKTN